MLSRLNLIVEHLLEAIIVKTVGQPLDLRSLEQHNHVEVLSEVHLSPRDVANGRLLGQLPLRPSEFCLVEGEVPCVVVGVIRCETNRLSSIH